MVSFELNSLQIECTLFFQENPYTFETLEGLAVRLGRNLEDLRPVLDALVENTILEVIGTGAQSIYRYIQPVWVDINEGSAWNGM
ncbi:hypothetical protein V6B33_05050 [Mangrovibacillus sp. Mu-81]|jgi:hypothetical protein|uniref:hypothetical protein n=1 Tax=Mangrovibacillus sp. Mu-81 TaxID=3121478 RepID=UPI002FE4F696